jgi:diguanylate cyclase (GGDEF)-like protein
MQSVQTRLATPEYAVLASWAFAQLIITGAIAMSGGAESHAMTWLIVPIVTLPARFGPRGLAAGVVYTAGLMVFALLAVEPYDDSPAIYATIYPVAALVAIGLLLTALMRSDVDHRTDAVIDGLTGMLNRRSLRQRLDELEAQSAVTHEPISVIAGDVDRFKSVNDRYGHATGDAVLVEVAYRLRKELRAFDLAYRLGGEEFLVLLPGATPEEALELAERLRETVAAEPAAGVDVTMSFGVAGTRAGAFDSAVVLAEADTALYEAKARGRDRVEPGASLALAAA